MNTICFHVDDFNWRTSAGDEWGGLRWKEIVNRDQSGSEEFIVGMARLAAGAKVPLHRVQQAETGYILSGHAKVRLGARSVELGPASAYYFPERAPHSIEALGPENLCYIYTYACEVHGQRVHREVVGEEEAGQLDIMNLPVYALVDPVRQSRWALSEDFETWVYGEPTKGPALRCRPLFEERFGQKEMMVGVGELDPGVHYTLHFHRQPEIYYILGGRGVVYVQDSEFEVTCGSVLYIGKGIVHGADSVGKEPLRIYYIYGTETLGQAPTWTPVEDVYTAIRRS